LESGLERKAYRHSVAVAAIRAMKDHDDPELAPLVLDHIKGEADSFRARNFVDSLEHLAFVARSAENKTPYRKLFLDYTDARERVQLSAVKALGVLGDERAIPVLESFLHHNSPEGHAKSLHDAANGSLNALRSKKSPPQELKDLRKKVQELEGKVRALEKK